MATSTTTNYTGVVHRRATLERGGGAVAGLTSGSRRDVGAWFT